MVLGFKKQFESKILAKVKRHTIRARRKGERQVRVGDRLDCYVDSRQKSMRLLGRWKCTLVQEISISKGYHVSVDDVLLQGSELTALAISDGFSGFTEMMDFWKGSLPFDGYMIHWDPNRPQPGPKKSKARKSDCS